MLKCRGIFVIAIVRLDVLPLSPSACRVLERAKMVVVERAIICTVSRPSAPRKGLTEYPRAKPFDKGTVGPGPGEEEGEGSGRFIAYVSCSDQVLPAWIEHRSSTTERTWNLLPKDREYLSNLANRSSSTAESSFALSDIKNTLIRNLACKIIWSEWGLIYGGGSHGRLFCGRL